MEGWKLKVGSITWNFVHSFWKRGTSLKWRTHMWDNYYHVQIKCLFTVNKNIIRVGTITLFCWPRFCLVLWRYQTVDICWWHKYFTLSFFYVSWVAASSYQLEFFCIIIARPPPRRDQLSRTVYMVVYSKLLLFHIC